jgi:hypothetical protein
VTAELELLNRLNREFERHPVDLPPDRCYSPATLAKSYLSAMDIKPPQEKSRFRTGSMELQRRRLLADVLSA